MRIIISLLVLVVVLLAAILFQVAPRAEEWEYAILSPADDQLTKELNTAGMAGYEVVSARRASSGEGTNSKMAYEMILKRRTTRTSILGR